MSEKLIAENRRARHDYQLLDRDEAGLVLTGTEVKSLRQGKAQITESYASPERGELWLFGDADGALALHVGVAAHRARPRARPPNVAAQHQEVADHVHVLDAQMMLRQAHAVDENRGVTA